MDATANETARIGILPLVLMAVIGLGTIFAAGHVQSAAVHDAAHDMRHALGFPCH